MLLASDPLKRERESDIFLFLVMMCTLYPRCIRRIPTVLYAMSMVSSVIRRLKAATDTHTIVALSNTVMRRKH